MGWSDETDRWNRKAKRVNRRTRRKNKPRPRQVASKLASSDAGLDALTPRERKFWEEANRTPAVRQQATEIVRELWKDAKDVSGLRGPMPKLRFKDEDPTGTNEGFAAWVRDGGGKGKTIVIPPSLARQLGAPASIGGWQDQGERLMLHEMAHAGQDGDYEQASDEGMAVLFDRVAGEKLGYEDVFRPTPEYRAFAKKAQEAARRRDILYRQFGGR